jgi:uncharacterized protein (DUF2141 family)
MKGLGAAALLIALAAPSSAAPPLQSGSCNVEGVVIQVQVTGLKNGAGTVRVQAYGPNAGDWLKKGRWIARAEAPAKAGRPICLVLPRPGNYAIAVRHDANASGSSDWNDGGGFSRNPSVSLLGRPSFAETAVSAGEGVTRLSIVMNYRRGLSVGPIRP